MDNYNYETSGSELLSNNLPFSFNNTHVKKLTNSFATKENVELEISNFIKNTKKEDQVILFLAGHGVLDKSNNYYYAPYNMDFNNVTTNGVSFKTIINAMTNAEASNKLLLMDTCHSGNTIDLADNDTSEVTKTQLAKNGERGSITRSNKNNETFKVSDVISTLFSDFLSESGVTILSASSGSDVAYENKTLSNGAFTSAYLKI